MKEKALRDTLSRAAWYGKRQISQSDCEISSNCGKKYSLKLQVLKEIREIKARKAQMGGPE